MDDRDDMRFVTCTSHMLKSRIRTHDRSLDTAVLRRMARKVYIPLPDSKAREGLVRHMLKSQRFNLPVSAGQAIIQSIHRSHPSATHSIHSLGACARLHPTPTTPQAAQMAKLVALTEGYSCSDLTQVLQEASMEPLRELGPSAIRTVKAEQLRPLVLDDFTKAMRAVRPSVPPSSVAEFDRWAQGLER